MNPGDQKQIELTVRNPGITNRKQGRKKNDDERPGRKNTTTGISTNIYQVASVGDCDTMRNLLDDIEDINTCNKDGYSVMHYATRYNRHRMIELLLERSADVNVDGDDGMKPLHVAAKHNAVAAIKTLLSKGAVIDAENKYGNTALYIAARRGNLEICELLTSNNADVNHPDRDQAIPLHAAAMNGNVDVFKLLLLKNANIFTEASDGETPLHYAAVSGRSKIMSYVLANANLCNSTPSKLLSLTDGSQATILHRAVEGGDLETVRVCLDFSASVNAQMENALTPLHLAAHSGYADIVYILIQNDAVANSYDGDRRIPLHSAVLSNNSDTIKCLIANGGDVNYRDGDHFTPLLLACASGLRTATECLISLDADIFTTDKHERTCLHLSILSRQYDILHYLMSTDASNLVNAADRKGLTPLHYAARLGSIRAITELVEGGCNITFTDDEDYSAVHYAAKEGHVSCVEYLVSVTPSTANGRDALGQTPLHLSAKNGFASVIELLILLGSDVSSRDDSLWTPLMHAAANGHLQELKLLLEKNSAINDQDKNQNTVLHLAAIYGHTDVLQYLMDQGADILLTNHNGKTCLDVAIDNSQNDVAVAIIKHRRWTDLLNRKNEYGEPVMQKLIRFLPDAAQAVMDRCVEREYDRDHPDHTITFKFQFIDPLPDQTGKRFAGLTDMAKYGRETLLSHPLAMQLIQLKWEIFGRNLYYLNMLAYITYLTLLTIYSVISIQITPYQIRLQPDTLLIVFQILIGSLAIIGIFKETIQLIQMRLNYIEWINILDWICYVTAIVFIFPSWLSTAKLICFQTDVICNASDYGQYIVGGLPIEYWQVVSGAIAILTGWVNMLLFLQRYSYGVYIVMFTTILGGVLKVLLVYSFMVIAFALGFHMIMQNQNSFKRVDIAIVRCFVMMIGEIDYEKDFFVTIQTYMKTQPLFAVALVGFLIAFCILMTIVLMNLMVGLAIGDIEQIRSEAGIKMLTRQINYIHAIEAKMPRSLRKRFHRLSCTIKPNSPVSSVRLLLRSLEITKTINFKKKILSSTKSLLEVDGLRDIETNIDAEKKRLKELKDQLRRQSEVVAEIANYLRLDEEDEGMIEEMVLESRVDNFTLSPRIDTIDGPQNVEDIVGSPPPDQPHSEPDGSGDVSEEIARL
ncbi:Transient receptor potential cation channel subfamily A member 1 [Trichoplax sp. H2]|nr:Transient receptor potential cation channel subfamily A member 1 [Trichoplax sp. H2]|eukprot:RDD42062.1 Transient receptor potential cation channel subfamily A member 1 [Trichoplax sp. H2]